MRLLRPAVATGRITYFSIPFQSGSPRILGLMNRALDLEAFREAMAHMRRLSPDTWWATHMMIGFPSETDEDFAMSMDLGAMFDEVMFIQYIENAQTPAARLEPKVSDQKRIERGAAAKRFVASRSGIVVDHHPVSKLVGETFVHLVPIRIPQAKS